MSAEQTVADYKHSISNDKTLEGQVKSEMSRNLNQYKSYIFVYPTFQSLRQGQRYKEVGELEPSTSKSRGLTPQIQQAR